MDDTNNSSQNTETNITPNNIQLKKLFFPFKGTCSLKKYWIHYIVSFLLSFIINIFSIFIMRKLIVLESLTLTVKWLINGINIFLLFFVYFHLFSLGIQRFRSIGKNPWLFLIPIYGFIIAKIIPEKNEQKKQYSNLIPLKKILLLLSIMLTISNTIMVRFIQTEFIVKLISTIHEARYQIIFPETKLYDSDDKYVMVEKKWFYYYLHIYDENCNSVSTLIFKKPETLEFLKSLKEKYQSIYDDYNIDKSDLESMVKSGYLDSWLNYYYINDFTSFLADSIHDNLYIELYGPNNWTVRTFRPEQAIYLFSDDEVLNKIKEEYEVSTIRYYIFDFDKIVEQFQYYDVYED